MGCSNLIKDMREARFTACAQHVFFILREQVECNADSRTPAATRWLAKMVGRDRKSVRLALKALDRAGWIKIVPGKRREACLVSVLKYRLKGPTKSPTKGPTIYSNSRLELIDMGPTKSPTKGPTVVSGSLVVSSAVNTAVSFSGLKEVLLRDSTAQNSAPPPPPRAKKQARKDPPYFRALTDHINATYTQAKGCKYPFRVWEIKELRFFANQYGSAAMMAWWDGVFKNDWCKRNGLSLRVFFSDLSKLQDDKTAKDRAKAYQDKLDQECESPVPPALIQKLAEGRRSVSELVSVMTGRPGPCGKSSGLIKVGVGT